MSNLTDTNAVLTDKLLSQIPGPGRILELGCGAGSLGAAYKAVFSQAHWTGVESDRSLAEQASRVLDRVVCGSLEHDTVEWADPPYDVILIGDWLERVREPRGLLRSLRQVATPEAVLLCRVRNMAHYSMLTHLLRADLTCLSDGPLTPGHSNLLSESSAAKLFLDAGWLPDVLDREPAGEIDGPFLEALVALAGRLRIPVATAKRHLLTHRMVFHCRPGQSAPKTAGPAPFSVVAPINDRDQFNLNVACSPGLEEIQADVVACRNTPSAGAALAFGSSRVASDWVLFCHQDVYFPCGSGHALARALAQVLAADPEVEAIGFAGLSGQPGAAPEKSGLVVDRGSLFDYPASDRALSVDEFAVLLRRDRVQLDPALGWHLWGTDICLNRLQSGSPVRIVRVPLFHNSYNAYELPADFQVSLQRLKAKYPEHGPIRSLCGTF